MPLASDGTTRIQQITGTFLYFSNVDYCILPALNEISSEQSAPTTDTNDSANWLMDYLHRTPGMPNPHRPCTTHLFIIKAGAYQNASVT